MDSLSLSWLALLFISHTPLCVAPNFKTHATLMWVGGEEGALAEKLVSRACKFYLRVKRVGLMHCLKLLQDATTAIV
jgi:hypothetical protein